MQPPNRIAGESYEDYLLFGECLRSEVPFPELRRRDPAGARMPTWTLRLDGPAELPNDAIPLGRGANVPCRIELFATDDCFWLRHSCTGLFRIGRDGREIVLHQETAAPLDAIRADVTGRALAVAMHAMGWATLHASAVELAGGAVAFMAPKHHGKSTLAVALALSGARLVTDDMLPIAELDAPVVQPGVTTARLNSDSHRRLGIEVGPAHRGIDGKHILGSLPDDRLLLGRASLGALYFLRPVAGLPGGAAAARIALPPTAAAMGLVAHAKIGTLLGRREAPVVFDRAVAIARRVPAYELQIVRDFRRLDDAVAVIGGWHGGSAC